MEKPTIYIASKTRHYDKWIALEKEFNFVSSWIHEAKVGESTDLVELSRLCIEEASKADYTILYAEEGDELKLALVEVGAALSSNKIVVIIGGCDSISTMLRHHPNVRQGASTMDSALRYIISHYNRVIYKV